MPPKWTFCGYNGHSGKNWLGKAVHWRTAWMNCFFFNINSCLRVFSGNFQFFGASGDADQFGGGVVGRPCLPKGGHVSLRLEEFSKLSRAVYEHFQHFAKPLVGISITLQQKEAKIFNLKMYRAKVRKCLWSIDGQSWKKLGLLWNKNKSHLKEIILNIFCAKTDSFPGHLLYARQWWKKMHDDLNVPNFIFLSPLISEQ